MAESTAFRIDKKAGELSVTVNPKIYPLPLVYQAADVFIDRAYVVLDGDPEKEIKVLIRPKSKGVSLERIAGDFNNELLNYAAYFVRSQVNKDLRNSIVERAFQTASGERAGFEEIEAQKKKVDLGTKVPLVGETPKKKMPKGNPRAESDIFLPWEKQKGAIRKGPKDLC